MSYFSRHRNKINLHIKKREDDVGLRECQVGAVWAVCSHFTSASNPALVVMPTGSGKTAVIMLLPFILGATRTLIISPYAILRDQTAARFKTLSDLVNSKSIPRTMPKPKVHIQETLLDSESEWTKLRDFDVVLATPNVTSRDEPRTRGRGVTKPPDNIFDLVLYDEAHHSRAKTWGRLLEDLAKAKQVLLTATPFRLDKKSLPGDIVYNYPIKRAIQTGIYRPVEYVSVRTRDGTDIDELLCRQAKKMLQSEKKQSSRTKLIIRTNQVKKSQPLIDLYESHGISIKEINYTKTLSENQEILRRIHEDKLDGVVCVGMIGEGLDIPELKIAVLHSAPKSFPLTIQFIGRIARPAKGQVGDAVVIANPDQIRSGRVSELLISMYHKDPSWKELVPLLMDDIVGKSLQYSRRARREADTEQYDARDICPFFSARLYRIPPNEVELHHRINFGGDVRVIPISRFDDDLKAFVTISVAPPPWGAKADIESEAYDLHLYYYQRQSRLLFESSTSDALARKIRKQILLNEPLPLSTAELVQAMQSANHVDYMMLGLSNVLGKTAAVPTYKILMGSQVQDTITPTDGLTFTAGHALARISTSETRGIGSVQARVWAIKRSSVIEFKRWCDLIAHSMYLHSSQSVGNLPDLPYISLPERIPKFPDEPIAVEINQIAYAARLELHQEGNAVAIKNPELRYSGLSSDHCRAEVTMFSEGAEPLELVYDITRNGWAPNSDQKIQINVDLNGQIVSHSLPEFFETYPPNFYLRKGGAVRNGELHKARLTTNSLPADCVIKNVDWTECDTKLEFNDPRRERVPVRGKKAIHDWLESKLLVESSESAIIVKDHATGELADFVVVDKSRRTIGLYHCKAASSNTPGARIDDLKALEQAYRSRIWTRNPELLHELVSRVESDSRVDTHLIKGNLNTAKELADTFAPAEWQCEVIIVQPGLSWQAATRQTNTNLLLVACYEWLHHTGAQLRLMCAD